MSPDAVHLGQVLLGGVRAAGSGGRAHAEACERWAGWALGHAEELLGMAADAAGTRRVAFPPQNNVTAPPPRGKKERRKR